jgi:hypothetical protein
MMWSQLSDYLREDISQFVLGMLQNYVNDKLFQAKLEWPGQKPNFKRRNHTYAKMKAQALRIEHLSADIIEEQDWILFAESDVIDFSNALFRFEKTHKNLCGVFAFIGVIAVKFVKRKRNLDLLMKTFYVYFRKNLCDWFLLNVHLF